MTDTTIPRCDICGRQMRQVAENFYDCTCGHAMTVPYSAAPRVPCPACGGKRSITEGFIYPATIGCPVCRGRGTVPSALAAAWRADSRMDQGMEEE